MNANNEPENNKASDEVGRRITGGCGQFLASCGHTGQEGQGSKIQSGHCPKCGQAWSWTCPAHMPNGELCKGRSLHC